MSGGRPTLDPKVNSVRVRLNKEMKTWLFNKSSREGISASQIVRDLIQSAMKSR